MAARSDSLVIRVIPGLLLLCVAVLLYRLGADEHHRQGLELESLREAVHNHQTSERQSAAELRRIHAELAGLRSRLAIMKQGADLQMIGSTPPSTTTSPTTTIASQPNNKLLATKNKETTPPPPPLPSPTTTRSGDDDTDTELIMLAIQDITMQRRSLLSMEGNHSSLTSVNTNRDYYVSRSLARCQLRCNHRGLSVRIPNMTRGCECVCVGGWTGAACQHPPTSTGENIDDAATPTVVPYVVVPMHREDIPLLGHNDSSDAEAKKARCRDASVAYYLAHPAEYRSDRALDQFWRLAAQLIPPYCSTATERVAIVDVGAHVGSRFGTWADALLRSGLEHRCDTMMNASDVHHHDSVVLLVEPNPLNLLPLHHTVDAILQRLHSPHAGSVIIEAVAAAHYNGEGLLHVNLAANRNKKVHGNERGFLSLNDNNNNEQQLRAGRQPQERLVRTAVHTVATLVQRAPYQSASKSQRPITSISILKVDAEGLDPLVLYGAHDVLPMTKLVVFECHKLWKQRGDEWSHQRRGGVDHSKSNVGEGDAVGWNKLKEVVEFLAKHGFESYMVGVFYWLPLTPPLLWSDVYEEKIEWSNCVAVRKGHPIEKAFSVPTSC